MLGRFRTIRPLSTHSSATLPALFRHYLEARVGIEHVREYAQKFLFAAFNQFHSGTVFPRAKRELGFIRRVTVRLLRPGKSAWNDDQSSGCSACRVIVMSLELNRPSTVRNLITSSFRAALAMAVSHQCPAS